MELMEERRQPGKVCITWRFPLVSPSGTWCQCTCVLSENLTKLPVLSLRSWHSLILYGCQVCLLNLISGNGDQLYRLHTPSQIHLTSVNMGCYVAP